MNLKQLGEALSTLPEPYASLNKKDVGISEYKEETIVVTHYDHPPIMFGTNIGWVNYVGQPLDKFDKGGKNE